MGRSYCSITTNGPKHEQLMLYFTERGRPALISVAIGGVATIFPGEFERGGVVGYRYEAFRRYQRGEVGWEPLVRDLSGHFACPVFAVDVFDNDAFYYQLYHSGQLIDEYGYPIDYFGPFQSTPLADVNAFLLRSDLAHAARLCVAFRSTAVREVARCLNQRKYFFSGGRAGDIHENLIDILDLPPFARYPGIYTAYGCLEADFGQGDMPAFETTPPHWKPALESSME